MLTCGIDRQKTARLEFFFFFKFYHNGPPERSNSSVSSSKQNSGAGCRPPHRSPGIWQPSLLPGQAKLSLPPQVLAAQKTDQGAYHLHPLPPQPCPPRACKEPNRTAKTAAKRHCYMTVCRETRGLEACSFRCGLGVSPQGVQSALLGLSLLSFTWDASEQEAHLKSEPWKSLVPATLTLYPLPPALAGSLSCCP